ncbi:MAG: sensor histidine kinase [Cyanobacteria bacterium SZAS-4]|nr:sensor histidine kinase [Cyanobacteria bacterium SZAS-4]
MKRLSIRKQLLTLFVPFLFGLWIVSAVLSFWLVSKFSGESFDRDLISSADSVVGRLRVKQGRIMVDLPPAAIAILKHDDSDKFYYRVLDSEGKMISGDVDLPQPSKDLQVDVPRVVAAKISNKNVHVAEIKVSPDEAQDQTVIVQVAETTNVRNHFQEKMLLSIAVPQLLTILLGLVAVWYGISKILTPLRILQSQMASRTRLDLSPLTDDETPDEVYPLVLALNHLLERLREEIKAHQRFIANAAHQLRTPLAGLKTYSSIGTEMTDVDDLKQVVHELDHGIDRASRMVTQLLALARTDSGNPTAVANARVDLNFLVSDVTSELIEQAILKKLELTYESSQLPAVINGEQTSLRHLIFNIIENAIVYTEPGGNILVSLKQNGKVTLSVVDSGTGIPSDEREKVFERFYRVAGTNGSGSGLGLSIVQEVANAHNASVSIEDGQGGVGTTIHVEFPPTNS